MPKSKKQNNSFINDPVDAYSTKDYEYEEDYEEIGHKGGESKKNKTKRRKTLKKQKIMEQKNPNVIFGAYE